MPHIPRAICARCNVEMRTVKNGVMIRTIVNGMPYYKVAADKLECSTCGNMVYSGFGNRVIETHDPLYKRIRQADVDVDL